jgi:hypothetical protein
VEIKVIKTNPVFNLQLSYEELQLLHIVLGSVDANYIEAAYSLMKNNGQTSMSIDDMNSIWHKSIYEMFSEIRKVLEKEDYDQS